MHFVHTEISVNSPLQEGSYTGPAELAPRAYEVQWADGAGLSTLRYPDILRKKPLFSKAQIKAWMSTVAECENTDYKPMPCVWRVVPPLSEKIGLPAELPPEMAAKMERAANNRAKKERKERVASAAAANAAAAMPPTPAQLPPHVPGVGPPVRGR